LTDLAEGHNILRIRRGKKFHFPKYIEVFIIKLR